MFDLAKKLMMARQIKMDKGSLILLEQKMVMCPAVTFVFLPSLVGDNDIGKHIYYACKLADEQGFTKGIRKRYGLEGGKLIQWMANIAMLGGWGDIQVMKLDMKQKRAIVQARNSPIALQYPPSKSSKVPVDHIMRGYMAGAAEVAFGTPTDFIETKCQAMGDPHCEFIAKPTDEFDKSDPRVQSQLDLTGEILSKISRIEKEYGK
jgi:predicted hydrocarbon binding protein